MSIHAHAPFPISPIIVSLEVSCFKSSGISDDEPEATSKAHSGDCTFYEHFERKFPCGDTGVSHVTDIEYPLCTSGYNMQTLMDAAVRK